MENYPEGNTYKSHRKNSIITFVLLGAVIYMATIQVKAWWSEQSATKVTPRAVTPRGDLGEDEKATIKLFEETSPSVVFITTINLRRDFLVPTFTRCQQVQGQVLFGTQMDTL